MYRLLYLTKEHLAEKNSTLIFRLDIHMFDLAKRPHYWRHKKCYTYCVRRSINWKLCTSMIHGLWSWVPYAIHLLFHFTHTYGWVGGGNKNRALVVTLFHLVQRTVPACPTPPSHLYTILNHYISLIPRPPPFFVLRFLFSIIHRSGKVRKTGKAWEHLSRDWRLVDARWM